MSDFKFMYLCAVELLIIIILLLIIIILLLIRSIIKLINIIIKHRNNKYYKDKFKECLQIIEQNKNKLEEENKNE